LTMFVQWVQWLRRKRGAGKITCTPLSLRSLYPLNRLRWGSGLLWFVKTVGFAHTQPHPKSRY